MVHIFCGAKHWLWIGLFILCNTFMPGKTKNQHKSLCVYITITYNRRRWWFRQYVCPKWLVVRRTSNSKLKHHVKYSPVTICKQTNPRNYPVHNGKWNQKNSSTDQFTHMTCFKLKSKSTPDSSFRLRGVTDAWREPYTQQVANI